MLCCIFAAKDNAIVIDDVANIKYFEMSASNYIMHRIYIEALL